MSDHDRERRPEQGAWPQKQAPADDNGVRANAPAAVAAASWSSGVALPSKLQRKFESSLGADLSGVRVHGGPESQTAASAVGAKAYTHGNDIHFGAGQYNPSSPEGEHLLAHEVAHTVQQQGGIKRLQLKDIAVSSPNDSHEVEADRAADAMVAGKTASVDSAPVALARKAEGTPSVGGGKVAELEGIGHTGTLGTVKLGPSVPVGPFDASASASLKLSYQTSATDTAEKPKEGGEGEKGETGGKPASVTVGTETDEHGQPAFAVEAEKKLKTGWGFTPTLSAGAKIGKEGEIGVGLSVTHPLFAGLEVKSKLITFDLVKWGGEDGVNFGVLSTALELSSTPAEFTFLGRKHKIQITGSIDLELSPDKKKIGQWLAENAAGYISAEAALLAGIVAVGLFEVVYGFKDAFSTGDMEMVSETFINSAHDYAWGLQAGCRDAEHAPPATQSKWAAMANVSGFLSGKMKLAAQCKKAGIPRAALVEEMNKLPLARDAWNQKWPQMKQYALDSYKAAHPVEMAVSGDGWGSGGYRTLKNMLELKKNPFDE